MLFATLAHVSGQLVCEGLEIVGQRTAQPTCHDPAGLWIERRPDLLTYGIRSSMVEQWAVIEGYGDRRKVLVIKTTEQDAETWAVAELERRAPEGGHRGWYGLGREKPTFPWSD